MRQRRRLTGGRPSHRLARGRGSAYAVATLAPGIALVVLARTIFTDPLLPTVAHAGPTPDLPATLLSTLANAMITMSAGVALSCVAIFRLIPIARAGRTAPVLLAIGMAAALLSMYGGLRFQYDMAMRLRYAALDLAPVLSRLHAQGMFLLVQVTILSLMATHYYLGERDDAARGASRDRK